MCRAIVEEYYGRIDRGDVGWVLSQFSLDAVYERADVVYNGSAEIGQFYRHERLIRGVHRIDTLTANPADDLVIVTGRFTGAGGQGDERDVGFADVWHFGADKLVKRRQTYLALGSAYVRE
jgi:ketosteroid isomerase-like protein